MKDNNQLPRLKKIKTVFKITMKDNNQLPRFIKEPEITVYRKDDGQYVDTDKLIFGDEIGVKYDKSDNEYLAITYKKMENLKRVL